MWSALVPHAASLISRSVRRAAVAASLAIVAAAGSAAAQDLPNRETAIEIRKRDVMDLDSLQSKFLALAEAFPAEKYSWRPGPGYRSWSRTSG